MFTSDERRLLEDSIHVFYKDAIYMHKELYISFKIKDKSVSGSCNRIRLYSISSSFTIARA